GGIKAPPKPPTRDPNIMYAEKDLSDALGLKAALQPVGKRGGRLVLHYKDYDQLEFLISRLTKRNH
ncbi:MAG: chromosome partitioning protein ParB, partial [Rhodospirillales bacterium]